MAGDDLLEIEAAGTRPKRRQKRSASLRCARAYVMRIFCFSDHGRPVPACRGSRCDHVRFLGSLVSSLKNRSAQAGSFCLFSWGIILPMRVVSINFITKPQRVNPRLTFPKKIAGILGLLSHRKKGVSLVIRKTSGEVLYNGEVPLRSGTEIYGAVNIKPALQKLNSGEEVWVEAWKPK